MIYKQWTIAELKKKFGASAAAVEKNLVKVNLSFGANTIAPRLHKLAAPAFKAAAADYLAKVKAGKAKPYKILNSGSFNWRLIKHADGTYGDTLSMHSFGIAIDINAWTPNGQGKGAKSDIPPELVKSMNAQGIFWGGHWTGASYDPMHFEYAPLSFPTVAPVAPVAPAAYLVRVTADKLNMRAAAALSAKVVGVLIKGAVLTVTGKSKEAATGITWLKTGAGWVSEKYTQKI